jgi:hypothetical protein
MSTENHTDHPEQDKKKYHFKIDNTPYTWDQQFITGAEVRSVGPGIPESMDLFIKVKGKPGSLVANEDVIDLANAGIEKFYSQESSSSAGTN